ncbi:head maturation protease, ClpP-related [Stieleria sp.]|uniref:head maturation protease, ClpP-related n=1 Tax=Stieleria sp. TaxID=2795976 RepID=UPI003567E82B
MLTHDKVSGQVRIDGDIGSYFDGGTGSRDFAAMLGEMDGKDLSITIKSDGGDVFEGLSIYNQLKSYPGKVSIVIDALAASIASVIVMAADELSIHEGSMLMIHNPWTVAAGDAKEFRGVADVLDLIGEQIAGIYAKRSGRDADEFLAIMERDTYIPASEAMALGLVDSVIGDESKPEKPKAVATAAGFVANAKRRLRARV